MTRIHRWLAGRLAFITVLFAIVVPFPALAADTLDTIRARGSFTWGADKEGGGPYVFPDPADPRRLAGFEVELADRLAEEVGRALGRPVEARFFQGQWETLPQLLTAGRIDVVLNGYEWTPERADLMASTIPYYVYELQLLARRGDSRIGGIDDLAGGDRSAPGAPGIGTSRAPRRRKVGVLGGSAAESYLRERFPGGGVEIISYDGNTSAMGEVATGKIDATLQDLPIAIFYAREFPDLRFAGPPVAPGRYVMYVRKEDDALRALLDRAIASLRESGALKSIYDRYGIWTPAQEDARFLALPRTSGSTGRAPLATGRDGEIARSRSSDDTTDGSAAAGAPDSAAGPAFHDRSVSGGRPGSSAAPGSVASRWAGTFLAAAGMTVLLSVVSMPIAIALGILIALGRLYGPRPLSLLLGAYVEVLRGTPLMLQLFFIFFLLPRVGVVIAALPAAILGLAINYSAYEAEIYRAGLQAIPSGQMDAALSLGMTRALALRRIVVPQAVRIVIPPVTNDFIALFKDTSVCSVITVVELTKQYNIAVMSSPGSIVPLAAMAALLYLAMSYPLSVLSTRMERRLRG